MIYLKGVTEERHLGWIAGVVELSGKNTFIARRLFDRRPEVRIYCWRKLSLYSWQTLRSLAYVHKGLLVLDIRTCVLHILLRVFEL